MAELKSHDTSLPRSLALGLIGRLKPQHYRELLGALWDSKSEIPYAWNVLKHGVCDGCSLGSSGLRDDVIGGFHLCMTRLERVSLNTMGALDVARL
ncbi:MAG TPA: hypothetical protein VNT76_06550, partial [Candidatus Binatus sp.]|nr:hypothetical protein [Candidatus Binatus sp.]